MHTGGAPRMRVLERMPRGGYVPLRAAYRGGLRATGRNPGRGHGLPDFIVIGAAKSGTSSLFSWLSQHPYVAAASRKEVEYFSFQYDRGLDWYRYHFPYVSDRARFAATHGREFLSFEASPYYLPHRLAPGRAAELLPDAKLVVTMRNPVDRAYSAYQMWKRWGIETRPFMTVAGLEDPRLDQGRARARNPSAIRRETTAIPQHRLGRAPVPGRVHPGRMYLMGGRYAEQLRRWFDYFPREQFHFVTTEELAADRRGAYSRLQSFLDLPEHHPGQLNAEHVAKYEPLPDEDRALLREYFLPCNAQLYELLGRDLGWDD